MARGAKTALITGSGRNIGRGCAHYLARAGFNVVINGSTQRDICDRTAGEVRDIGTDALVCMADLGDQAAVDRMAAEALSEFGRVDVLLNNAAIRPLSPFLEMTDADLAHVMNVNTYSAVWLSRAFLPGMIENGWGRIINTGSAHAKVASPFKSAYVAAKHGLSGLTKVTALEGAEHGVRCNLVCPGYVHTPLVDGQIDDTAKARGMTRDEVVKNVLLAAQPTKEFVTAEQIGGFVAFLCSPDADQINGADLSMDGGWVAQ